MVPLSSVRLVSVMNTGAVCYTFTVTRRGCQSLCILGLLVQPPPTRVSRQRPAAKVSLKLRLLHGCLPLAGEKSAAAKKGIAEILLNGGAVSQTDQHIVATKLLHRVQRQLFPDCIMSSQTWTLVGTASPQNGIGQNFMKLIHSKTCISRPYY